MSEPGIILPSSTTTTTFDIQSLQDELDALNASVTKQGATVKQLKKDGAAASDIEEAVKSLQALKVSATTLTSQLESTTPTFNRKSFDDLVLRKMFVVPSFEIHGGVKGLFDLGPPACALKVCGMYVICVICDVTWCEK
jgi:glycyl-tRNA synthetase